MAGRKPDFTEEELIESTKRYMEENPFRELNYTDIANYINRTIQSGKKITYRHLSRCQAVKELIKNYNQKLRSSTSSISGNGNPFLEKDIDVNAIAAYCTTVSKVHETITRFAEAAAAYQSELGRLENCCKNLQKRAEKAETERNILEESQKNMETEKLKKDISDFQKTNRQLRKQLNTICSFMQKRVLNEVAIRHLADIRILPLNDEDRQQVLQTPEIWMDLLTEDTDIQKILSKAAIPELTKDRPIYDTSPSAKAPEKKDSETIIYLSDTIDRLKKL